MQKLMATYCMYTTFYHVFCDSVLKTTTALPFSSAHGVSITPKG